MKRITIIGSPGAGKSTLSRTLAERLDLPLVHIDQLFWSEGWQRRDRRAYRELIKEATAGEEWIIDGNYISTLAARLERAPLVIWLDFPTWRCVWGIVRRWLEHRGRSRPDMPSNCPERLNREFFLYVLRFRKEVRPDLPGILENYPECEVVHLTSPRDVAGWLLNVSSSNEENDDGCV